MNKIDVLMIPQEISCRNMHGSLAVVIDVLRASSTIVTALARGSSGFFPIYSTEAAQEKAQCFKEKNILLCGERKGKKILGFDLGNSPHEFKREIVRQKQIVFTTTNGVKALEMTRNAAETVVCSFLNMSAVCDHCLKFNGNILIVCAGRDGQFSLEDTVCAGMLINCIRNKSHYDLPETDASITSQLLYKHYCNNLLKMLKISLHGKYLMNIGLESDLEFCSSIDLFDIVPVLRGDMIILCK